jgi:DNA transposition AAA+ family ATPase
MNNRTQPAFIMTRQHERFVEFCDSCRLNKYIGVCTGRSGVGKTKSAEIYSGWQDLQPLLMGQNTKYKVIPKLGALHTAIFTPDVSCTVKRVQTAIALLRNKFDKLIQESQIYHSPEIWYKSQQTRFLQLIIIDKAHRLSLRCLEAIADISEKQKIGIVLIGMPGFDRKIRSFEQVHNLVGFYHTFNTPRTEELAAILEARWQNQNIQIDQAAVEALEKVTSSNIRKLININAEMGRVCELNSISIITPEVVQLASRTLLLDPT